jgi:hypothetical protein
MALTCGSLKGDVEGDLNDLESDNTESTGPTVEANLAASIETETDLRVDQQRAYDIVIEHLQQTVAGERPPQLLMQLLGEGGTGKTKVIERITQRFEALEVSHWLRKGAYTGIAASLIKGSTLHTLAKISHRHGGLSVKMKRFLERLWQNVRYLIIDEISMVSRRFLATVAGVLSEARHGQSDQPFSGLNVIICGDYHQFPPVGGKKSDPLYYRSNAIKDDVATITGRQIYEQFTTVVILREQIRAEDDTWIDFLRRLRSGSCTDADIDMLEGQSLSSDLKDDPNWQEAVLVTPRHATRQKWNGAALCKHCVLTGHTLYHCPARDTISSRPLTLAEQYVLYNSNPQQRLPEDTEIAIGMKVMITSNLQTELEIANGSRGEIVDILLDPQEPAFDATQHEVHLRYLPAYILVRLYETRAKQLPGLQPGVIPIAPMAVTYQLTVGVKKHTVSRLQLPITGAYAFTNYRSQGQTLVPVIIDLAAPPTGGRLSPFNIYVACSRGKGRCAIRVLQQPERRLLTTHPSDVLRKEDRRLEDLDAKTKAQYLQTRA